MSNEETEKSGNHSCRQTRHHSPCQLQGTRREEVNNYLVEWRNERENEHHANIVFEGYQRDNYIISARVPDSEAARPRAFSVNLSAAMTCI